MSKSSETIILNAPETLGLPERLDHIDPSLIEYTKHNGDALDELRKPLKQFKFHRVIRAGMLTTAATIGVLGSLDAPEPHFFVYGVAAGGMAEVSRRVGQYRTGKKVYRHLEAQQKLEESTGEPLELLRTRSKLKSRRELNLVWNAEFTPEDTTGAIRTRLETVAGLAQQSDLKTVVVPAIILERITKDSQKDDIDASKQNLSRWLKDTKKLPIAQYEKDQVDERVEKQVLSLTPEECFELVDLLDRDEPAPEASVTAFTYAWDLLKTMRPNHTMFRRFAGQYDSVSSTEQLNGVHRAARDALRRIIAGGIDDTVVQRSSDHQRVRINLIGSIDDTKPRVHLQGTQSVGTLHGEQGLHAEDSGSLLGHLGISVSDIRHYFKNPSKLNDRQRIEMSEVVMLYELAGWDLPYKPEFEQITKTADVEADVAAPKETSIQLAIAVASGRESTKTNNVLSDDEMDNAERIELGKLGSRKVVRYLAVMAVAATLALPLTGNIVQAPMNYMYHKAQTAYINKLHNETTDDILKRLNKQNPSPHLKEADIQKLLEEVDKTGQIPGVLDEDFRTQHKFDDPYTEAFGRAYMANYWLKNKVAELTNGTDKYGVVTLDAQYEDNKRTSAYARIAADSAEAGVGNVKRTKNTPLWLLDSKGLSTEGYWSEHTNYFLGDNFGSGTGLSWGSWDLGTLRGSEYKPQEIQLDSPKTVEQRDKWVSVEAVHATNDYVSFSPDKSAISIPVLSGMRPIAIELSMGPKGSNKRTTVAGGVAQLSDGTFVAVLPDSKKTGFNTYESKVYLKYWLAPAGDSLPYGPVRATHKVKSTVYEDKGTRTDYGLSKAPAQVDTYIPNLPPSGIKRTQKIVEYFRENFDYALAPLQGKGINAKANGTEQLKGIPDYVDLVMKRRQANCNVANTLLAVDNTDLNVATGFANSVNPHSHYDVLSSAESHLWTVDAQGNRYDATPVKGLSEGDSQQFKENFSANDFKTPASKLDKQQEQNRQIALGLKIAAVIGTAGALVLRRRAITEAGKNTKITIHNSRIEHADRRIKKIASKKVARAMIAQEIVGHVLFSNGTPMTKSDASETGKMTESELRTSLRINRPPVKQPGKVVKSKLKQARANGLLDGQRRRDIRLGSKLVKLDEIASRETREFVSTD